MVVAKLYLIVKRLFESTDRMPGRDAFIELLRANGLMVAVGKTSSLQDNWTLVIITTSMTT
ncbi:MAG: hypothetical protein ACLSFV_20905 [Bacteroides xylanisolvens]